MSLKSTWRDWWASRTMRWNMYMGVVSTVALPIAAGLSEEDWATIGLSTKWVLIVTLAVKALSNIKNIHLRTETTESIVGRSGTGDGTEEIEDKI